MKKLPARVLLGVAVLCGLVAAAVGLLSLPWIKPPPLPPPRVETVAAGAGGLVAGAGVAQIELPPDPPIGGFARWSYASEGVRDPVTARALVLTSPGNVRIGLVSVELLLVPEALDAAVRARVRGLALDGLVIAATHTHASPGGYWENLAGEEIALGRYRPAMRDRIANAIASALRKAADDQAPAELSVARAEGLTLARNRNGGAVDGRLSVLRLSRPGGQPVAELAVYAAHPTTLGKVNRRVSGDWPGRFLAAEGGHGVRLFFQGALGDQSTNLPVSLAPTTPESYAAAVEGELAKLQFSPPDADPALAFGVAEVGLPLASPAGVPRLLRRAVTTVAAPLMPAEARVSALRLGPVLLVAVPGEPTAAVGAAWRAAAGKDAEIISLADGYVGYVETAVLVREGRGEAQRAYFPPELAGRLEAAVAALAPRVNGAAEVAALEARRRAAEARRAEAARRAEEERKAEAARAAGAKAEPAGRKQAGPKPGAGARAKVPAGAAAGHAAGKAAPGRVRAGQ